MTNHTPTARTRRHRRRIPRQLSVEDRANRRLVMTAIGVLALLLGLQAWQLFTTTQETGRLRGTSQLVDTMGSGRMLIQTAAYVAVTTGPAEVLGLRPGHPEAVAAAATLDDVSAGISSLVEAVDAARDDLPPAATAAWTGDGGVLPQLHTYVDDVDALAVALRDPATSTVSLVARLVAAAEPDGLVTTLDQAVGGTAVAIDGQLDELQSRQRRLLLVGPPLALVMGLVLIRPATAKVSSLMTSQASQLRAHDRVQRSVALAAAHNLREPLRKALVFATRDAGDHIEERDVVRVRGALVTASRRLDAFVRYASVGVDADNLQWVDLCDVARTAAAALGDEDDIVVTGTARAKVDPQLVGAMFDELLRNARSARVHDRASRIEVHTELLHRTRRPQVVVSLRDNGRGIPPDRVDRAMALFGRVHDDLEGEGVGLALAERIASAHGGRLGVSPARPHGTVVTVELPVDTHH